ncbi:MAG: 30S ribosomal protein S3 [bacterium]
MGQKTHPLGLRLGIIKDWDSRWYAKKGYADLLHEDLRIRDTIKKKLHHAGIPKIRIERASKKVKVDIFTARPGIIIGKQGVEVEKLRKDLQQLSGKQVTINIQEIKDPNQNAQLIAENIAAQIEKRISYRRAMKKSVDIVLKSGAEGVKIECGGRLGGAEMSRNEWYLRGRVPLHTLRADIDYGQAESHTTYGIVGVKVWIFKGEILDTKNITQ